MPDEVTRKLSRNIAYIETYSASLGMVSKAKKAAMYGEAVQSRSGDANP
jgi:hypothetical protein